MRMVLRGLVPAVAAVLLTISPSAMAPHSAVATAQTNDASIQADVQNKALNKSQFKNVKASVQDGIVTLTGTVDVYDQKADADRRVHRIKNVKGVENQIDVAGPEIPDAQLQDKLVKAIQYDRVGYGTTAFNAIGVNVQNGVVTLSGTAYGPVDADSAVAVAANTKGVKDVINDIQVDPVSPMDDRIRMATYRAVYGFPSLNKYAIDPGKPIRISVRNGNVTLYGEVMNQGDKDAAGIRANSVPGVFSVTNNLQVAGQPEKK
ncbi:BON domain-containing protein [Alloacidobacterium sp.]|uniref:BON domain-containing protein n=1 Tax=Alloacidobacterium sp. TaxID=2951999 RepID=UPI002D654072|nr:BON domain-containing protein [Alloacidobacterium sp.]HYK37360.1 BON domain-containing protein [Alloacidobacterium sp.]